MVKRTKLGAGAVTADSKGGNPFLGVDPALGIAYDMDEATTPIVFQEEDNPIILGPYSYSARKLVSKYLKPEPKEKILDIGSGTGISTLEVLLQQPMLSLVVGLEISQGMLEIARYKFHQTDGANLLEMADATPLPAYWKDFREKSKLNTHKVRFILEDIEKETEYLPSESIGGALASHVVPWVDLPTTFKRLNRILRRGGRVIWNVTANYFDNSQFPLRGYDLRYNDLIFIILEELRKRGLAVKDYQHPKKPRYTFDSIVDISSEQKFDTELVGTMLFPVDFQDYIPKYVPVLVNELIVPSLNSEELSKLTPEEKEAIEKERGILINEAIASAVKRPESFRDKDHKYDIVSIFRSIKTN